MTVRDVHTVIRAEATATGIVHVGAYVDLTAEAEAVAADCRKEGAEAVGAAVVVMDETTSMIDFLHNSCRFFAHESCGQCTPCREGSLWMSKALHRMTHGGGRAQDAEYLAKIADNIPGGRTICAFGEACSWPVQSFVAKFKDEFVAKGAADEARRAQAGRDLPAAVFVGASARAGAAGQVVEKGARRPNGDFPA